MWWNINTFNVWCHTRKCNNSKAAAASQPSALSVCLYLFLTLFKSKNRLSRTGFSARVSTLQLLKSRAEIICTQYFDAKITNVCEFPHGNLTFDKTQTGFEFSTRSSAAVIYLFSSSSATCWQQTSQQASKHRSISAHQESARAGEIFERPASFVCMSQPVALLLVLFRRLAPYLQLSSVFLLWHVDTRFFSFYYTTHQRAASKPCTMVRDVHLFGGAGLCSLGALTHHSGSRPQPSPPWCSWIMAARLICLPSIKQEPPYHQTEQNAADPSARS